MWTASDNRFVVLKERVRTWCVCGALGRAGVRDWGGADTCPLVQPGHIFTETLRVRPRGKTFHKRFSEHKEKETSCTFHTVNSVVRK